MAVGLSIPVANAQLDTMPSTVYVQLHVGDPGSSGSANQSSESTRVAATLLAAADASRMMADAIVWPVWQYGITETITHLSFWNDISAGALQFSSELTADQEMSDGKVFELLSFDISHVTLAS